MIVKRPNYPYLKKIDNMWWLYYVCIDDISLEETVYRLDYPSYQIAKKSLERAKNLQCPY